MWSSAKGVDRASDTRLSPEEIEARRERGHRRFARNLDTDAVLDAVDDGAIAAYLDGRDGDDSPA